MININMKYFKFLIIVLVIFLFNFYLNDLKKFGARTMNPIWNRADLDVEVSIGNFIDATTTPIAIQNPFSATSTIDFSIYDQTGAATSTYTLNCGTSTTAFGTPSDWIFDAIEFATNTIDYLVNGINGGTNSKFRILVGETEWIVCKITTLYSAAFTNASNTYDGNYKFRWFR